MTDERRARKGGGAVEILVVVGIVVAWFVLQIFVLPKLGVPT